MPPDHGYGFDDNQSVGPARPDMAKQNPEQSVAVTEPGPWSSLLHDCELLAEGGILDIEV